LITAREFMITGLRLLAASRGVVLAAEKSGKIKTVFQLLSAGVLLFGHFLAHDLGGWPGAGVVTTFMVTGGVLFALATVLTVMSGTGYLIKYWHLMREDIVV
jgi:CDP-diacylglycerol--glycerol-3-phosphate 3-phosphatidyltransferase